MPLNRVSFFPTVHNKTLQWSARVIDTDEYNMARAESLDLYRQRKRLCDQRMVVFHAAIRHAAAVSGVIHATSLNQVIEEEEFHQNREARERLKRVEYEKKLAISDLNNALSSVDSLVDAKANADVRLAEAMALIEQSGDGALVWQAKCDGARIKNVELSQKIKEMSSEIGN
jgi:hypothetical protein